MIVSVTSPDFGKLSALISALGPSNRRRLNAVAAKSLENLVKRHISSLVARRHSSANRLGARPSGHYRKGVRLISSFADAFGGSVSIPIAGISRALHDINLYTPTRFGKNYLTIPAHPSAYGSSVAEMKAKGWKIFRPGKAKILLGYRSKGEKPVKLFTLAKKVHQKMDPSLLPSPAECSAVVSAAMTKSINSRIANATA